MLKNLNMHCCHCVLSVLGSVPVELREESLLEVSVAFSHLYPPNKYIEFGQTFEYNIERTFKYVVTLNRVETRSQPDDPLTH